MATFRFYLQGKDQEGRRRKYRCPSCGRRSFTRYIDSDGLVDFPDEVGICDHRNSCGYHYTPKEFFREHPDAKKLLREERPRQIRQPARCVAAQAAVATSYIPQEVMLRSLSRYEINPFHRFLCYVFGKEKADELCSLYHVGTSRKWGGSTVYWQVDTEGRVRDGKIMIYDPRTGHRVKTADGGGVSWVHSELRMKRFNLCQCLFGEHLLPLFPSRKVMIVESEKTALIASVFMPEYLWLATGGLGNLQPSRCRCLEGRDVMLLPDLGAEEKWQNKLGDLRTICQSVTISTLLQRMATEEERQRGEDIADVFLSEPTPHMVWHDMKVANPHLSMLEKDLDLHIVGFGEPT